MNNFYLTGHQLRHFEILNQSTNDEYHSWWMVGWMNASHLSCTTLCSLFASSSTTWNHFMLSVFFVNTDSYISLSIWQSVVSLGSASAYWIQNNYGFSFCSSFSCISFLFRVTSTAAAAPFVLLLCKNSQTHKKATEMRENFWAEDRTKTYIQQPRSLAALKHFFWMFFFF